MKHEKHGSGVTLNTNAWVPVYPHKLFLHFPWHQGFSYRSALNVPISFNQNFSKMSETSQSVLWVGLGAFLWEWASGYFLLTPLGENLQNSFFIPCQRTKTREKNLPWGLTLAERQKTWSSLDLRDPGAEAHHCFHCVLRQDNSHHMLDHFGFYSCQALSHTPHPILVLSTGILLQVFFKALITVTPNWFKTFYYFIYITTWWWREV